MLWGLRFHKEIKKEIFENLLLPNCKRYSFDIWYVASSIGLLPSLLICCPRGQNWPSQGGRKLEHKNKERKFQNSSSLKLEGPELSYLVYSISLWTFTKFVHMIALSTPLGQKWPRPGGHNLEHRNKGRKFQNSSFLKLEGLGLSYLVYSFSCRPLPSLFV